MNVFRPFGTFWRCKRERRISPASHLPVRLALEELEDRTVLTSVTAGVGVTDPVTIAFNTGLNASTVNTNTFQLLNSAGQQVAIQAAYNSSTETVTLTPTNPLNYSSTYTVSIPGGSNGPLDTQGQDPLPANYKFSYTTQSGSVSTSAPNPIVAENQLAGTPLNTWDIGAPINDTIDGYTTSISTNIGQTVDFKINTPSTNYVIDIYRTGYYGGDGARLVASENIVLPSAQDQPNPVIDPNTQLADYGTWNVSASWNIPTTAVSGLYFADLIRNDGVTDHSMIPFVVTDLASHSDVVYMTADTTWEAYNEYGNGSLYVGNAGYSATYGSGYNYGVSYNRPFTDQEMPGGFGTYDFPLHAELPMIMWMEENGYDVSYLAHPNLDQDPGLLLNHKIFMDCGHDEYWSAQEVAAVQAAQAAGVNTAFFSGNELYWEFRWANSIDGSNTPYRSMICYKESFPGNPDPQTPPLWTGTWMDPAGAGTGGYIPGNAVDGTLFQVNRGPNDLGGPLTVPYLDSQDLFWANTSVAQLTFGQMATLGDYEVGYEWDEDVDNGFRPAGLIDLSATTQNAPQVVTNAAGTTFGPEVATNSQTLFRAKSGALVFGAGTVQWSWGLSSVHDDGTSVVVPAIQQATVNLFAMMGVQPATLQAGLVPGPTAAQMDTTPPASTITSTGADGFSFVQTGATYTISGTATDAGGGHVAGVEISVDGGQTWHPAIPVGESGNSWSNWAYNWVPTTAGTFTIETRAVNDSLYLEAPSDQITIVVKNASTTPPQIAGITATVVSNQSATVSWITDKASTSVVNYGTSPQNLNLSVSNSTATTNHSVTLTGLTPNTTYYYQVVSVDSYGNSATAPATPARFVVPAFYTSGTGFTSGTLTNTVNSESGIILPAVSDFEFNGTSLPGAWTSSAYATGGSVSVANGAMTVNGALAQTTAAYGPGESLQFMANFGGQAYQIVGFGSNLNSGPYAVFDTGPNGDALYAQSMVNGQTSSTLLEGGNLLGSSHQFRIDWNAASINYWIDGTLVDTQSVTISTGMKLVASVAQVGSGNQTVTIITDDGTTTVTLGPTVSVNWMRVAPYSPSGTYTSQVFNAGTPVTWNTLNYTGNTPANTSLTLYVRMGNTPTPDNTWTSFIPLADFGPTIGTYAQYFQYQAVLNTTDPDQTPSLASVGITYTTGASTIPPVIVTETPAAGTTAANFSPPIEVEFDHLMNLATITNSTFYLQAAGSSSNVPATISFPGGSTALLQPTVLLSANTTYTVTVVGTVSDTSGTALGSNATWSFTTPSYSSLTDSPTSFGSGTTGSNTLLTPSGVTLAPSTLTSFTGTALPSGWTVTPWGSGGTGTLANGMLTVDGALAEANTFYKPGQSLEFIATFSGDPYQQAGFANNLNSGPWAIFSTGSGGALYALTNNGTSSVDTLILGNWLNAPHLFRIDWTSSAVTYSIDGNVVASNSIAITSNMRPVLSDYTVGGGAVTADWVGLTPVASPGAYVSRVFDASAPVTWKSLQWTSSLPSATSLVMFVRMGNTATPDNTWTNWVPLVNSGAVIGGSSRYLQYEAVLATSQPSQAPVLNNVTIQYTTAPNTNPPAIVYTSPASGAVDVNPSLPLTVAFNELMNSTTISNSTIQLFVAGSTTTDPATVTLTGSTATLQPSGLLLSNTNYDLVISGSITDSSGNALGSTVTIPFTTGLATLSNSTTSEFATGTTGSGTYVSSANGGEVTLAPMLAGDFSGTTLPAGWSATPLGSGGSATVANGFLSVDGALVATNQYFGPGFSLQFQATLSGDPYQSIGLGTDLNGAPWAIFTTNSGGALYTYTNNGATSQLTPIAGNWLAAAHDFQINWSATAVTYSIDGTVVATDNIAISSNMRPVIDDYNPGDGVVTVSSINLTPYASSGTYQSPIFDGGATVSWNNLSWIDNLPSATGISLSVRMGNTATPDNTWTSWIPLSASGALIGGSSRYLQYEATLSTSNSSVSPDLLAVTASYSINGFFPPRIISTSPASGAVGVNPMSPVVVNFSELMNAATINTSTIYLQAQGSSTNVAATVSYSGSTATLTPSMALAGNTVYTAMVSGSITDASGNALGSNVTWSFTTGTAQLSQTTTADFNAGTQSGTTVTSTSGGAVQLAPAFFDDFTGSALSANWTTSPSGGGTSSVTVANSILSIGATEVASTQTYSNVAVEGSLDFGAEPYQHFGLATSLSSVAGNSWALFSTGGTNNTLFARVNANGTTTDVSLGALPTGFHDYLIQPVSGGFAFYVDGSLQTTISATLPSSTLLNVVLSDYNGSAQAPLQADWVRVNSYPSTGTFTSSVLDATRTATWETISWDAILPPGTSITVQTQTSDDGNTWSSWANVSGVTSTVNGNGSTNFTGTIASPNARYIRYRVILTTSDPAQTPTFLDIVINWS
jgi:hypothetical protein